LPYDRGYTTHDLSRRQNGTYGSPQMSTNRPTAIGTQSPTAASGYGPGLPAGREPAYRTAARPGFTRSAREPFGVNRPDSAWATEYPSVEGPARDYPTGGVPNATIPRSPIGDVPSGYRTGGGNPSGYRSPYPEAGASTSMRSDVGAYRPYLEPGAAQFQGRIEKSTGSNGYDYNRPRLY
jgi:hypothetical protein